MPMTSDVKELSEWLDDAAKGFVDSIGMQMGSDDVDQEKIDELGEFAAKLSEAAAMIRRLAALPAQTEAVDLEAKARELVDYFELVSPDMRLLPATRALLEQRTIATLAPPAVQAESAYVLVPGDEMYVAVASLVAKHHHGNGVGGYTSKHLAMAKEYVNATIAAAPHAAGTDDDLETWIRSLPAEVAPKLREAYEFYKKHQAAGTGEVERARIEAKIEAYEDAAQHCRYYFKHQNFERDLDTGQYSDFADGTEVACDNLSDKFEGLAETARITLAAQPSAALSPRAAAVEECARVGWREALALCLTIIRDERQGLLDTEADRQDYENEYILRRYNEAITAAESAIRSLALSDSTDREKE